MGNSYHDFRKRRDRGLALPWIMSPTRTFVAGAVLLLHAVLLQAVLWTSLGPHARPQLRQRTIWFNFHPETHPHPAKPGHKAEQKKPQPVPRERAPARPADAPPSPVFSLPSEADREKLLGSRDQLFDCAPEYLVKMDDAQRSRCRTLGALPGHDPSAVDYADRTGRVPGAKQWERELARKNAPLLLPCGNPTALDPVYTTFCTIGNIANGFTFKKQYQNQRAYFDKPPKITSRPGGLP